MSTLQSYVSKLPSAFADRYSTSGHLLRWGNELLEELQEREFLSASVKECGQIVTNDCWIVKPSVFLSLDKVYNPEDWNHTYRVEEVNDKFKLLDVDFEQDDTAWEVATSLSTFAVGSLRIAEGDILDKAEDDLKNYLFLITAGTMAGTGIVLAGNDATVTAGTGYTVINFLHDLDAVLSGTKVTEAKLVPPTEYVMMKYHALITEITALGDEFPIPEDCEKRLVPTWLRWKCEEQAMAVSKETLKWEARTKELLFSIQSARLSRPITPVKGRRLVGMENLNIFKNKSHPEYSSF